MLQFFANLPWYVRGAFMGGGTMITGFSSKLPDALQEIGLLLGIGLVTVGAIASIWHFLNERRIKGGKGKLTLEPATLLPAFAVIALVGVLGVGGCLLWQSLRPSPVQAKTTLPAATNDQLSDKPLKKMLTAYDVEQRLRAIDSLLEYLDPTLMHVSAQGEQLNQSIYKRIEDGTAIAELDKFAEAMESAINGYFVLASRVDQRFPDIYAVAVQHDWPITEIPKKASLLRAELQEMTQRGQFNPPRPHASDMFKNNKLMHDWREVTSGKFWTWINQTRNRLADKRREYEQAEVYPTNKTEAAPPKTNETGLFQWNFESLLGQQASDKGHYVSKFWVEGVHNHPIPIQIKHASIVSETEPHILTMRIRTDRGYVLPEKAYPVPPGARVYLAALLYDPDKQKPNQPEGIPAEEFLQTWGAFTFNVSYIVNHGEESYSQKFDYPSVVARVAELNPPKTTPKVTARLPNLDDLLK